MARRHINKKRANKLRKLLVGRPPAPYIDLVDWLKLRRHARTSGEARRMIAAGRVMIESHPIGREDVVEMPVEGIGGNIARRWVGNPRVPAHLRSSLRVVDA